METLRKLMPKQFDSGTFPSLMKIEIASHKIAPLSFILTLFTTLVLTACGGGGGSGSNQPAPIISLSSAKAITSFALAGVIGVINETSKVITVTLPFGSNVSSLAATFASTGNSVTVGSIDQLTGATINNFSSPDIYTVTAADGTSVNYTVMVYVAPISYSVGGVVSGLNIGNAIVLQNNSSDNLTVIGNGVFTFPTQLNNSASYLTSILTLPTGQPCVITYGSGVVTATNISNINVFCGPTVLGVFSTTGAMATARSMHTATLLNNGKVLVTGGNGTAAWVGYSAELYDPASRLWSATGGMTTPRMAHTATLLPNGKILVVGGFSFTGMLGLVPSTATAEIYDLATGVWTSTTSMGSARAGHTATLLPNGTVLVAGGLSATNATSSEITYSSAEIYDPATQLWTATGVMNSARNSHTAVLLTSGKVLVSGGDSYSGSTLYGSTTPISLSDIYDPTTGVWTATGSMSVAREQHTSTLLPDNKILVTGGTGTTTLASIEKFSSGIDSWSTSGSLPTPSTALSATLIPTGKILIAGGANSTTINSNASLFDPALGVVSPTSSLLTARTAHTATLLQNGQLLIVGGTGVAGFLNSAELYW